MYEKFKRAPKTERCSNCHYNKKDHDLDRYYCSNEESDRFDDTTEYYDSCEKWVPKA